MIRDTSAQDRKVTSAPNRKRRYFYIAAAVVVVGLIAAIAPGIARLLSSDASASLARLRIAPVTRGTLTRDVSVQGRVVAAVSPTLYAPSPGFVKLDVHAGDKVDKGAVLAEVDSPELTNRLKQEQATLDSLTIAVERAGIESRKQQAAVQTALDQADIDRQTAARELERNTKGFKLGALPELDVLRAKDALSKAELTVKQSKKDVQLEREALAFDVKTKHLALDRQQLLVQDLTRQVDELKVRSPVAGQVGQLLVQQSANVAVNAPLITVVDLSALEVEVQVPEVFAHDLAIGMPAEIQDGATKYAGKVSAISPEVVAGQVTGRVAFAKDKPAGLRQNQQLTTRILIDQHPNVLMVERGPFVDTGAGRVAYVVHGDIAERTSIQVGATSLNAVEIVSGVKEGDRLVISGTDAFNGAQRVSIH
ncbi:MAG: efflux RND transporter periplasmic adaptor subunit [Rhodanobacteraceae bacterium]